MEDEKFYTGYCRQLDSSRTVECVFENGALREADCCYGSCIYETNCTIGQAITEAVQKQS